MNKKVIYFGIFIILSTLIVTATFTLDKTKNKWETSDDILFSISGTNWNLTDAIKNDLFKTSIISISDSPVLNRNHNTDEIWISVNNIGMSFKDAIEANNLCGITDDTINDSNAPDPSHLGTEIEISSGISLQDSINDGTLVKTEGTWNEDWNDPEFGWNACSKNCGGTQSRLRTCDSPSPFCGGAECQRQDSSYTILVDRNEDQIRECHGNAPICLFDFKHEEAECEAEGGTVRNAGSEKICEFLRTSCPSGWTRYLSWGSTSNNHCIGRSDAVCSTRTCDTGGHSWENKARETCRFDNRDYRCGGGKSYTCSCTTTEIRTCYAFVTSVGCY